MSATIPNLPNGITILILFPFIRYFFFFKLSKKPKFTFINNPKENLLDRTDNISHNDILTAVLAKLQTEKRNVTTKISSIFENFRVNHNLVRELSIVLNAQNMSEPKKV
jgi:hypothetical protein